MENENEKCLKQKRNFFVKFWWIFPIVNLVSALLIVPSANHNLWGLTSALFIVFVVLLVVQGIIFIYCLCKKEWWQSVGSAIGCIVCFIAFYIISFIYLIVSSSQPDPFGKEHPIPEGMEYLMVFQKKSVYKFGTIFKEVCINTVFTTQNYLMAMCFCGVLR